MRNAGRLSEDATRFYISELTLAIEYLHSKRIAYRGDFYIFLETVNSLCSVLNVATHRSAIELLTTPALECLLTHFPTFVRH